MDIEEWIEAYEDCVLVNRQGGDDPTFVLYASDLRDLLKNHVIVERSKLEELEGVAIKAAAYLSQAAEDVCDWGAYASEYFQDKHGLRDDIKLYEQRAEEFEAMLQANEESK